MQQQQLTDNEQEKITKAIVAATKIASEEATRRRITYRKDNEPALLWQTDYISNLGLRMINKWIKDTGINYCMRSHLGGIEVEFYKI